MFPDVAKPALSASDGWLLRSRPGYFTRLGLASRRRQSDRRECLRKPLAMCATRLSV